MATLRLTALIACAAFALAVASTDRARAVDSTSPSPSPQPTATTDKPAKKSSKKKATKQKEKKSEQQFINGYKAAHEVLLGGSVAIQNRYQVEVCMQACLTMSQPSGWAAHRSGQAAQDRWPPC